MSRINNAFSGVVELSGIEYQPLDWVNKAISDWRAKGGPSTEAKEASFNGSFPRVIFDGVNVVDLTKSVNKIPSWFERISASGSTSRASPNSANQAELSGSNQNSSSTSVTHPFERSVNGVYLVRDNKQPSPSGSVSQPISNRSVNQVDTSSSSSRIPLRWKGVDKTVNPPVDGTSSGGDTQINSNGNNKQVPLWRANGTSFNRSINGIASSTTSQPFLSGSNNQASSRLTSEPVFRGIFSEVLSGTANSTSSRRRYNCSPRLVNGSSFSGDGDAGPSSSSSPAESGGSSNQLPTAWLNATFVTGNIKQPSRPIPSDRPFDRIPSGLWPPEEKRKSTAPFPLSPHDCGLTCACEMIWLVSDRSMQELPLEKSNSSHYRNDSYEYRLCEDPIRSPQNPPRDCQLVQPSSLQHDMYPYITHPNSNPPVAVIPRACERDPKCPFCEIYPELHNVRYMCAFHMYYFAGVRSQDDFNAVNNLRGDPAVKAFKSTSVEAMGKTIQKCRDLLVGSTPEPSAHYSTWEGTGPLKTDVGHIGQEFKGTNHAAHSFTLPEEEEEEDDDDDDEDDVFSSRIGVNYNTGFMRRLLRSIEP
ncbi:hypothetical protein K449DRAFT_434327 [Hypoxylon sp. EC38]|nr:hypothetical protein K449DRAFT_434327 [Hypoxylon sp. EC38]